MKKFYSALLAGTVALSAMAATPFQQVNVFGTPELKTAEAKTLSAKTLRTDLKSFAQKKKVNVAKVKANDETSIAGKYLDFYYSPFSNYLEQLRTECVEVTVDGDEATFEGLCEWGSEIVSSSYYVSSIKGTVDGTKVSIPLGQVVGAYQLEDLVLYGLDADGNLTLDGNCEVEYEGGLMYLSCGLVIGNHTISAYFSGVIEPVLLPNNATLSYTNTVQTTVTNVELPMCVFDQTFEDELGTSYEGMMMSSVDKFGEGYAIAWIYYEGYGYVAVQAPTETLYISAVGSYLDFYMVAFPEEGDGGTLGVIADFVQEDDDTFFMTWPTGEDVDQSTGATLKWYYWSEYDVENDYYLGLNTDTRLALNSEEEGGVEKNVIDNSNAPVEYYNLQGVRVANPTNGIVIKRQGSNVEKVVVR